MQEFQFIFEQSQSSQLQWAKENLPAVVSYMLTIHSLTDLKMLDEHVGRFLGFKTVRLIKANSTGVAHYGLVTGPFTLSLHLKATDIFMGMFDPPEKV